MWRRAAQTEAELQTVCGAFQWAAKAGKSGGHTFATLVRSVSFVRANSSELAELRLRRARTQLHLASRLCSSLEIELLLMACGWSCLSLAQKSLLQSSKAQAKAAQFAANSRRQLGASRQLAPAESDLQVAGHLQQRAQPIGRVSELSIRAQY